MATDCDRIEHLIRKFNTTWIRSRPLLESGRVIVTPFARNTLLEVEYIVALVAVAEAQGVEIAGQIRRIQDQLKSVDPTHYYYPSSSLHVTVAGCTPFYKERSAISDERIRKILQTCGRVTQSWREPLRLYVNGLNAVPSSVFLQVASLDGGFVKFRQQVLQALRAGGEEPADPPDAEEIHMNIMRFTHADRVRLLPLVAAIESMRDARIGEIEVNNVELDLTDRIQSPVSTRVISRFSLAD